MTGPKPNTQFELDIKDIEIIENSLLLMSRETDSDAGKKEISKLMAKIFHQKNWYRPKNYISG